METTRERSQPLEGCWIICAAIRDARAVSGAQPIQFSPHCAARPAVSPNYPSNPPPHPRRSRAPFGHAIGIRTSARSHNWAIFAVPAVVFTHNRPSCPTPSRMCANSDAIASQPEKADKFPLKLEFQLQGIGLSTRQTTCRQTERRRRKLLAVIIAHAACRSY